MINYIPLPITALLLFVSVSCSGEANKKPESSGANNQPPTMQPNGPITSWPATLKTDSGSHQVTIQPEGGAIEANKHFAIMTSVEPSDTAAGTLKVTVDADMPAHGHGMNTQPETSAVDGATFRTEGMLLHMSGDWIITVDVTQNGKAERATFPVTIE